MPAPRVKKGKWSKERERTQSGKWRKRGLMLEKKGSLLQSTILFRAGYRPFLVDAGGASSPRL